MKRPEKKEECSGCVFKNKQEERNHTYNIGWNAAIEACDNFRPSMGEVMEIAAQGWCAPRNEHKVMDPDLCYEIATAIHKLYAERLKGE